jgi:hypothetical protein
MPHAQAFRRLNPWSAALLIAVLLAAQALGHWHRVDHQARLQASATADDHRHWGHGLDSGDCQALDQLGLHLGLGSATPPSLATSGAAAVDASCSSEIRGVTRWRVQARAPPRLT